MRPDMDEIIIERPRGYRGCRSRKGVAYPRKKMGRIYGHVSKNDHDNDNAPHYESMGKYYSTKWLSDNLRPLIRYLSKQVGRPWNKVHSEISQHISLSSTLQKHILDHLKSLVAKEIKIEDGIVYYFWNGTWYRRQSTGFFPGFYVCPKTGLLKVPSKRKQRERSPFYLVAKDTYCVKKDGAWYCVKTMPIPLDGAQRSKCFDAYYRAVYATNEYRMNVEKYPVPWVWSHIAIHAWQMSKKEIKQLAPDKGIVVSK